LEAGYTRLAARCDEIMELIEGDGSDEGWKRSVRGRIHRIMADLATADKLAYAATQVKEAAQAQRELEDRAFERAHERQAKRFDTWLQVVIAVTAVIVALTSLIGAYAALF